MKRSSLPTLQHDRDQGWRSSPVLDHAGSEIPGHGLILESRLGLIKRSQLPIPLERGDSETPISLA